jgi:DNA-binding HxlR family transcriptional regulator
MANRSRGYQSVTLAASSQFDLRPMPEAYERAQRLIVVDLSLRIIELNRDSYLPGVGLPDAALLLMILIKIFEAQMRGRPTTASALARALEMPRPTLYRRLRQLIAHGLVEKDGASYKPRLDALSKPEALRDFRRRVTVIQQAAQKLSELDKFNSAQIDPKIVSHQHLHRRGND